MNTDSSEVRESRATSPSSAKCAPLACMVRVTLRSLSSGATRAKRLTMAGGIDCSRAVSGRPSTSLVWM